MAAKKQVKRKKKPKTQSDPDALPFEQALAELKQVVAELEAGNLSLSQSLEKYESGISHLKHCHQALASAEKRIELLVDLDETGKLITEPFDDTASTEARQRRRKRPRAQDSDADSGQEAEADDTGEDSRLF